MDDAHDVWLPHQRLVPEGSLLWWVIEWVGWVGLVEAEYTQIHTDLSSFEVVERKETATVEHFPNSANKSFDAATTDDGSSLGRTTSLTVPRARPHIPARAGCICVQYFSYNQHWHGGFRQQENQRHKFVFAVNGLLAINPPFLLDVKEKCGLSWRARCAPQESALWVPQALLAHTSQFFHSSSRPSFG